MIRLRANVRTVTGLTHHERADAIGEAACETPAFVVIAEQEGAYLLLRYTEDGDCVADAWHLSLEEAKQQAEHEYEIREGDWVVCSAWDP